MQRMSGGRDQWQLIVHRLHSLNNVTARGSNQESFQSRSAIFDAWEKSGSPGNKKFVFSNSFRKKKRSKWVKEKNVSNCFEKEAFSNKTFLFKKEWTIKQENNKDNSKLSVFLLIEWLVCDTDSPWVIRQWMLSIISICSLNFCSLYVYPPSSTRGDKLSARLGNLKRWSHGIERSPRFSKTWE